MTDMDKEKMLIRYLDGDLSDEEERQVLHLIAEDSEMRSMLRFERKLGQSVAELYSAGPESVPAGFSDQVISRIKQLDSEPDNDTIGVLDTLKYWAQKVWTPKTMVLRPAYMMTVLILLLASVTLPLYLMPVQQPETSQGMQGSIQQVSESADQVWLRFVYIDQNADSVSVAGDFSNWEPIPLNQQTINGEQVWTGLVSMSRGEHRYMFVKNGEEWVTDPLASVQREDGFGNKNAVIYL